MKDSPLSDLLRQATINTENQLMSFSYSIWNDCLDTSRSTGEYIIFYQWGPIYHGTHVPGPVVQSSSESEYNASCNVGMALVHFRMLIHELLKKDTDIVSEATHIIIFYSKYYVCMSNNGKDTKHTRHITIWVNFVINGENCKLHKIELCEGGLQLSYIENKNLGENDLNFRIKYIMAKL